MIRLKMAIFRPGAENGPGAFGTARGGLPGVKKTPHPPACPWPPLRVDLNILQNNLGGLREREKPSDDKNPGCTAGIVCASP